MEKREKVICRVENYYTVEVVLEQLNYKVVEQTQSDDGYYYTYIVVKNV